MLSNEVFKGAFNSIINNNPDAIFVLSVDKKIIQVNKMASNLFGYSQEDVEDTFFSALFVKQQSKKIDKHFDEAFKGFASENYFEVYHKNGEILQVQVKTIPLMAGNTIEGFFCITIEITNLYKEEKFQAVFNSSTDAIEILNLSGNIIDVNYGFENLYGWKREEVIGNMLPVLSRDRIDDSRALLEKVKLGEEITELDESYIRKDGSVIDISRTTSPVRDINGEIIAISRVTRNITTQNQLNRALKESEERYRLLADNSLDLVQLVNCDGVVTYASPSHKTVLGYDPVEYNGKWVFYQPDMGIDESFKNVFLSMAINQKPFTFEIVRKHKEGFDVWIELKVTPMFDQEGHFKNMMLIGRDITERKKLQEHLEYLSYYDTLTKIPNRRLFKKRFKQAIEDAERYNRQFAIMFMDMDKFKHINDTLGHDVGDELLKQFVKRVKVHLRETDTLARQGGDEFIILLSDIQKEEDAFKVANLILKSVQETWQIDEHNFHTGSSIGIAFYPKDGKTRHELLKHADKALYKAKEHGGNNFKVYTPDTVNC